MKYLLVLLLAGCSTIPDVVEVKIPYAVSCIESKPAAPEFVTDAQLFKMLDANFVTSLHIDRLKRINYINELEAVLTACERKTP